MERNRQHVLELLEANGFDEPRKWVAYAESHDFKRVPSEKIVECPDCHSTSFEVLGQYVYYSTLIHLKRCRNCDLVFADVRLDPGTLESHFETAYKDETYFLRERRFIFRQISKCVDRLTPLEGAVLDIGLLSKPLAEWGSAEFSSFKQAEAVLQPWIDERHSMAVAFAQGGGEVPGFKLKDGAIRETITKPQEVFERAAQSGVTIEQYLSVISVAKGKFRELFAVVTGLKGKALDAKFDLLLDGCVESKQTAASLVKQK